MKVVLPPPFAQGGIKWWVYLMTTMPCILMYGAFECQFMPVRLSKIEMRHPVAPPNSCLRLKNLYFQ